MSQIIFGARTTAQNRQFLDSQKDLACALRHEGQSIQELYQQKEFREILQNPEGSPFATLRSGAGNYAVRVVELPSAPTWDRQFSDPPTDREWVLCPISIAVHAALLLTREWHRIVPEHHMGSCAEPSESGHRAALWIAREHPDTLHERFEIRVATTASAVNIGPVRRIECALLSS